MTGSLRNVFMRTIQPSPWIIAIAALVLLWVTVYIAVFFCQVNSTLSDASWGDVSWYNQLAYNLTHGRPLQTSIYRQGGPGVLVNPFPYVHSFSLHVNFTPYLILWLYKFMPTVNGLYLITILFNITGFLTIGWLIARRIFPHKDRFISYALVCAVFFHVLPSIDIITYKGHFGLFAGPFILAAYYFCLRDKKLMLVAAGLLLCGISEDMAMFMCSFSAYLFIFEKHIRKTALLMGIMSVAYLAFAFFVIQPASETGLTLAYSSALVARLHLHADNSFGVVPGLISEILYSMRLAVALIVMVLLSGLGKAVEWKKPIGLLIIAPASSWFVVAAEGAGHHTMPILACTFLALMLLAKRSKFVPVSATRIAAAVFIIILILLPDLYRMGRSFPFHTDARSLARMESNKSTLREISALPEDAGVSYWTDQGLDAFMTSRNNVWRFPEYFDSADYLVIQKDADQTFFSMEEMASGGIAAEIKGGQFYTSGAGVTMSAGAVKQIKHELIDVKATHEVKADTVHTLILKRKEKIDFPSPESTIGLSWIKHINKN